MIAVILAAGQAQRFGGAKQVALFNNKPMVSHVFHQLPESLEKVFVVTGSHRELVEQALVNHGVDFLFNHNYKNGMSSSVKVAAEKALELKDDLLLTFADLPYVEKEDYQRLIDAYQKRPLFSSFANTHGPPAILPYQELEPLLDQLRGDRGLKQFFSSPDIVEIAAAEKDIDRSD